MEQIFDDLPKPFKWWEGLLARIFGMYCPGADVDGDVETIVHAYFWRGRHYVTGMTQRIIITGKTREMLKML